MTSQKLTLTLLLAASISTTALAGEKTHWGYGGEEGPEHWGDLSPTYSLCKVGKSQSPIDISGAKNARLATIKFNYKTTPIDIVNNGHTIQLNYAKGSSINFGGKPYALLQFHFHSPSEHHINGKPYDMVAHLVHQAADGQLGVIGVLMKVGKAHPVIAQLWKHLPETANEQNTLADTLNVADLLPANHRYFNYSGSLTTPPCSEGVNWIVLETPVAVSAEQVAQFNRLFPKSVRPVQALNGRTVHSTQ